MTSKTQPHDADWKPAEPGKDGVYTDEHQLPLNHRLRAEALAKAGKTKDPGGQVTAELIAATAARLEAEAAAKAAAKPGRAPADDEGTTGQ